MQFLGTDKYSIRGEATIRVQGEATIRVHRGHKY